MCVSHTETSPDLNVNMERFRGMHVALINVESDTAISMPAGMLLRMRLELLERVENCTRQCII